MELTLDIIVGLLVREAEALLRNTEVDLTHDSDEWYFRQCAKSKVGTDFFLGYVMNVWKLKEEIIAELQ
jgi:hypothetical protein